MQSVFWLLHEYDNNINILYYTEYKLTHKRKQGWTLQATFKICSMIMGYILCTVYSCLHIDR